MRKESKDKKKRKRRAKNDGAARDFICGCGKSYLSYPALYTHLKQKHDGNIPVGTTRGVKIRGRPKAIIFIKHFTPIERRKPQSF